MILDMYSIACWDFSQTDIRCPPLLLLLTRLSADETPNRWRPKELDGSSFLHHSYGLRSCLTVVGFLLHVHISLNEWSPGVLDTRLDCQLNH